MSHSKRLKALEDRAEQAARSTDTVIAVVDVRDMPPNEAKQVLDAKRAELNLAGSSATLIILQHPR